MGYKILINSLVFFCFITSSDWDSLDEDNIIFFIIILFWQCVRLGERLFLEFLSSLSVMFHPLHTRDWDTESTDKIWEKEFLTQIFCRQVIKLTFVDTLKATIMFISNTHYSLIINIFKRCYTCFQKTTNSFVRCQKFFFWSWNSSDRDRQKE